SRIPVRKWVHGTRAERTRDRCRGRAAPHRCDRRVSRSGCPRRDRRRRRRRGRPAVRGGDDRPARPPPGPLRGDRRRPGASAGALGGSGQGGLSQARGDPAGGAEDRAFGGGDGAEAVGLLRGAVDGQQPPPGPFHAGNARRSGLRATRPRLRPRRRAHDGAGEPRAARPGRRDPHRPPGPPGGLRSAGMGRRGGEGAARAGPTGRRGPSPHGEEGPSCHRAARPARHVHARRGQHAPATLTRNLPGPAGAPTRKGRSIAAARARAQGDRRGHQQIMAALFVDALIGRGDGIDPSTLDVGVLITDRSLLAPDHADAALVEGYGPVPYEHVREEMLEAMGPAWADPALAITLRRLYADPDAGQLVAVESRARSFPPALARLLRLAHQTCRAPHCDADIRQLDHIVPWSEGGATSLDNGNGLCAEHNQKEAAGLTARVVRDEDGTRRTVEWTTRYGQTARRRGINVDPLGTGWRLLERAAGERPPGERPPGVPAPEG